MSDLVYAVSQSPDPLDTGCKVTGKIEPGVVFPTVEPAEGTTLFIGETALIEAVAAYCNITPNQAKFRIEDRPSPKQAQFDAIRKELDKVKSRLERWEQFRTELEANGMTLTNFHED